MEAVLLGVWVNCMPSKVSPIYRALRQQGSSRSDIFAHNSLCHNKYGRISGTQNYWFCCKRLTRLDLWNFFQEQLPNKSLPKFEYIMLVVLSQGTTEMEGKEDVKVRYMISGAVMKNILSLSLCVAILPCCLLCFVSLKLSMAQILMPTYAGSIQRAYLGGGLPYVDVDIISCILICVTQSTTGNVYHNFLAWAIWLQKFHHLHKCVWVCVPRYNAPHYRPHRSPGSRMVQGYRMQEQGRE